jgi:hypothetical protein
MTTDAAQRLPERLVTGDLVNLRRSDSWGGNGPRLVQTPLLAALLVVGLEPRLVFVALLGIFVLVMHRCTRKEH